MIIPTVSLITIYPITSKTVGIKGSGLIPQATAPVTSQTLISGMKRNIMEKRRDNATSNR